MKLKHKPSGFEVDFPDDVYEIIKPSLPDRWQDVKENPCNLKQVPNDLRKIASMLETAWCGVDRSHHKDMEPSR